MAIYHCSMSNVSRGSGASACASYAYISGEKVYDERRQETFEYARQERVLATGTIIPEYAPSEYADPKKLFNEIEKYETADNARTAKKIEVALPKELDRATQEKIVVDYIKHNLTNEGYCATYAMHDGQEKKNGNDHAHIMISPRPLNQKGEWCNKRKTEFALDEEGKRIPALVYEKNEKGKFIKDEKGNKIPVLDENGNTIQRTDGKGTPQWVRVNVEVNPLDTKEFLSQLREQWAVEVNKHLEPSLQIDHRSHKERGLDIKPTIHEGYAAREIEKRGGIADRCEINREIKQENEQRLEIKHELEKAKKEMEALNRKEREIHDRLRNVGRRTNDYQIGGTSEGERQAQSKPTNDRAITSDHTGTRTKDYTAELLAHRRAETERELARLSKEREEAKRAEQELAKQNNRTRELTKTKEYTATKVIERGFELGR